MTSGRTAPTDLTRAFTGRLARGIRNEFMREPGRDLPPPGPRCTTGPPRQQARQAGDAALINRWAGEICPLAAERPAADVVPHLDRSATTALAEARRRHQVLPRHCS